MGRPAQAQHRERQYWSGHPWQLASAAYWENIAHNADPPESYRLGDTLAEELGACLLGGYGMPYALCAAAFQRLQAAGVFSPETPWSAREIETLLTAPLRVGTGQRRYRFPRQRAHRIRIAMDHLRDGHPPAGDRELRDWLTGIPGVGPKTASWVVRNHRGSSHVAILDIHVIRAGTAAGVFSPQWKLPAAYDLYETAFLGWAHHAHIDAALLDACIWGVLAHMGEHARDLFGVATLSTTPAPVWPT